MNDLQARLASLGEGERTAALQNPPGLVDPMNDPTHVHAAIAAAAPEHQAIVLQRLRLIDQIAQAIRGQTRDPVERARMAQHIAQMHPEMGIDPGMLTPQAMSDANIAALHEMASEATMRVALAGLGGKGATGAPGASSLPSGPSGMTAQLPPVQGSARRPTGASHAAQGFTILGVD